MLIQNLFGNNLGHNFNFQHIFNCFQTGKSSRFKRLCLNKNSSKVLQNFLYFSAYESPKMSFPLSFNHLVLLYFTPQQIPGHQGGKLSSSMNCNPEIGRSAYIKFSQQVLLMQFSKLNSILIFKIKSKVLYHEYATTQLLLCTLQYMTYIATQMKMGSLVQGYLLPSSKQVCELA